jgi:fermentation-respiration switch protein FrsA (DUF1100 family)
VLKPKTPVNTVMKDPLQTVQPFLWKVIVFVFFVYVAIALLTFLIQRKLQYFPATSPVPLPRGKHYRDLEEFTVTTSDGVRLVGWYWQGQRPVTLLVFHGNGGHRGHRIEWLESMHSLGLGICVIDYRGYGGSDGSPSEEGLYRDAEAALGWLKSRQTGSIVYFGESLGSGVATELALRFPPAALILESAFTSAVDIGQKAYPFLPVRLLMKDRYESLRKIGKISAPLLMIHGEADSLVPVENGRTLFEAAAEPKEWYGVPAAGHNDLQWVGGKGYLERINQFLRQHVPQ